MKSKETKKVLWRELRRTEFAKFVKADAVVIIPVGSLEQHGNHLPIDTDTNCCFTIAQRAAQVIDDFPVLVLPPIWTGYSPHHMIYHGTITLKFHTFIELLTDVAASVYAHGFKKILFLNGHGGNAGIITSMRLKLADERGMPSIQGYTYWELPSVRKAMKSISETDRGSIGHAGEMETSLQLYLQPELVDTEAAVWDSGVAGDPTTASREKGKYIIDAAVNALVETIREYRNG